MSQDFHQPAFEFLQHAHGNTGHQNMNWHGFCSGTAFYEWSRWNTYRRRTVNPSQAGWHFDIVLWDTHRAGATLMTPAWCYETLPPIGSPVWCASHGEALFSQTRRKEHEKPIQKLSPAGFGYRYATSCGQYGSVVLFCKLLIAFPFVHFCGPDHILPSYFSILLHQNIDSTELSAIKVHCIVYSTTILYILHNWLKRIRWMNELVFCMRDQLWCCVSICNERGNLFSFCVPNITTSHIKECSLPLFKNEKYGSSVCVMYF